MGWQRPVGVAGRKRLFDLSKPLFAMRALDFAAGKVARGARLPQWAIDEVGCEVIEQMHFVRQLDHEPLAGVTPESEIVEPSARMFRVTPGERVEIETPAAARARRRGHAG